jgi:hypothetical protein
VTGGNVSVVGAGVRVETELTVEVTVEAGRVTVVKEPEIEVVTVEAGSVVVTTGGYKQVNYTLHWEFLLLVSVVLSVVVVAEQLLAMEYRRFNVTYSQSW